MKIYVAGPIGGRPDGNRDAFLRATEELKAQGHEVINPHEVDHSHEGPCTGRPTGFDGDQHRYGCYLLADLRELATCDAIAPLTDWHTSPGAMAEVAFAAALGIRNLSN